MDLVVQTVAKPIVMLHLKLKTMLALLSVLACLGAAFADYTPEALADQITSLPGAEALNVNFNQFSGYIKVADTKNLHYWLVESQGNPATDPVAFWTNGGPGCSGLLGAFTEQGPFRPNKDLTLSYNQYSWNTVANMVFIEAPCGVGFSYSDRTDGEDYKTGDDQTAKDNYALIQGFLNRFPQYRSNDLYITSESYGGHYMPTLAKQIVDENSAAATTGNPVLNFKGFAVGNPATTFYSAIPAGMETYWGHQVISKPLYDEFSANCKDGHKNFSACEMIYMKMYREVGDLNPYALDYPVCVEDGKRGLAKGGRSQRTWLMNYLLSGMKGEHTADMRKSLKLEPVEGYEPCADDYMTSYLALPNVKKAIHVKDDIVWTDCSRTIKYDQRDGSKSMTPIYNYLIDGKFGLNLLVYSGDDDDVCATIGTQSWIWDLGYDVSGKAWETYTVADQTAGYVTKWKNTKLAFATVHGAGHEVPTYKPEVALSLFKSYLAGELTNA